MAARATAVAACLLSGCGGSAPSSAEFRVPETLETASDSAMANTCVGPYADYWEHPENRPLDDRQAFRLSQAYPTRPVEPDNEPWLQHDPFSQGSLASRKEASREYMRSVLHYILEGNVGQTPSEQDFSVCENRVRRWYHVPWMDANPSKGREWVHGLTRELSPSPRKLADGQLYQETAWAVGFYNEVGAYTLGSIFPGGSAASVNIPAENIRFPPGTVIGKALFTSAIASEVPYLSGAPEWQANVRPPVCGRAWEGETMVDPRTGQEVQCRRSLHTLRLTQFDIAVADSRSPTGWVFGTFIYNGLEDSTRGWEGLEPVGLMWGNDPGVTLSPGLNPGSHLPGERGLTPPEGIAESVVFTDTFPQWLQKDLGCAGRLDGPVDNPRSSCMSCHASASVPLALSVGEPNPCGGGATARRTIQSAPILGDFSQQCGDAQIDRVWFRNITAGESITHGDICGGHRWVSLDYSLQLSEALANYMRVAHAHPAVGSDSITDSMVEVEASIEVPTEALPAEIIDDGSETRR